MSPYVINANNPGVACRVLCAVFRPAPPVQAQANPAAAAAEVASAGLQEEKSADQGWQSYYAMVAASAPAEGKGDTAAGATVKRASHKVYQASWLTQVRR